MPGAILLFIGLAGSCAILWWRRDLPALLAAGALAAMAFYFLPTRAHERYLFPALALLLPMAAVRARLLVPYVILALSFAATLYFAFTRYSQNDLHSPAWLEETLFTRNGQILIAVVMLGPAHISAGACGAATPLSSQASVMARWSGHLRWRPGSSLEALRRAPFRLPRHPRARRDPDAPRHAASHFSSRWWSC